MYEEIYEHSPIQNWGKQKFQQRQSARGQWREAENKDRLSIYGFQCRHCQAYVYAQADFSGVQNRNHCPYCLWSRHVDHTRAGDRMSACKAVMQPIGLTVKFDNNKYGNGRNGELMLIHRCRDCGKLSINRIAADDLTECLLDIYHASFGLDSLTRECLEASGIRLLQGVDDILVTHQLKGILQQ
jgi:hypothetical protein